MGRPTPDSRDLGSTKKKVNLALRSPGQELRIYINKDLPNVEAYLQTYKGKAVVPRAADGRLPLFTIWAKDIFRRAIDKVGKTETTNLRAALETASRRHIARNQVEIDDEVVQHLFLHQRNLSLTRYMSEGAEKMCQFLWDLVDPEDGDVI